MVIAGGVFFWMSQKGGVSNNTDNVLVSTSPSPAQSVTLSPTPKLPKNSSKPTPGIIIKELTGYKYWADLLDPLNRRLVLDENCTTIVPSQVTYPNNIQIMLDNTFSSNSQVLKIGSREYSLKANDWLLVTLSSSQLPAHLTMFCGSMELGQLDLE